MIYLERPHLQGYIPLQLFRMAVRTKLEHSCRCVICLLTACAEGTTQAQSCSGVVPTLNKHKEIRNEHQALHQLIAPEHRSALELQTLLQSTPGFTVARQCEKPRGQRRNADALEHNGRPQPLEPAQSKGQQHAIVARTRIGTIGVQIVTAQPIAKV